MDRGREIVTKLEAREREREMEGREGRR